MAGRVRLQLPSLRTASSVMAVLLIAMSVITVLLEKSVGVTLQLIPHQVLNLALWQPFTWLLIEITPMGVMFGALIVWSIGGSLEQQWGKARFVRFALGVTFCAGLMTVAVGLVSDTVRLMHFGGGSTMAGTLWVTYGLMIGSRPANFWGLPTTGNVLALIGVGFVILNALMVAWQLVVPEAIAIALGFALLKLGGPTDWWERFQSGRLRRELAKRSSHLKVVEPSRNMPGDSDKFLH